MHFDMKSNRNHTFIWLLYKDRRWGHLIDIHGGSNHALECLLAAGLPGNFHGGLGSRWWWRCLVLDRVLRLKNRRESLELEKSLLGGLGRGQNNSSSRGSGSLLGLSSCFFPCTTNQNSIFKRGGKNDHRACNVIFKKIRVKIYVNNIFYVFKIIFNINIFKWFENIKNILI